MSVRPGVNVTLRSTPPARSIPTDTGVLFAVGLTDMGPANRPLAVRSMADFERLFGLRQSYSVLYDAIDVFFREGGNLAYISLVATAKGPGATYNNYKVGVRAGVAGGTFVVFVQDPNNVEIETSPDLANQAAAIAWATAYSNTINLTLGASANNPAVVAAGALAGGADDRASITDTQRQAALDAIKPDLGPGQVAMPGVTTDTMHVALVNHAGLNRRVALLDAPDTATVATLQASAVASRVGSQKYAGMFAPWVVYPGVVPNSPRTVPPSALIAGLLARNDSRGAGPADPAAGDMGVSLQATDLSQVAWTDAQRGTLNTSGINVIRNVFGTIRNYGWRSLVDPVAEPLWQSFGHARLYMAIAARAAVIGEAYEFDTLDGAGKTISAFNSDLKGMLMDFYRAGNLYGATPQDAFTVDTGSQVNTPATLTNNELHAVLNVKMSPFAEMVQIEVVKRAITEVL
jgi:phage tail sheath protein FI